MFAPYLPRLVRRWAAAEAGTVARSIDGTLVSADISGFTTLSERLAEHGKAGAEELILVLSGVFEGLIGIAHRRGGDVLKFRGDALLILFDGAGHEARACRAATEMQWLLSHAGPGKSSVGPVALRMSIGVYTGPVTFFVTGSTHRELIVTGPAATETIRLEDAAEPGEILISAATAAAVEPAWVGEPRGAAFLLDEVPDGPSLDEPAADELDAHVDDARLAPWVPEPLRAPATVGAVEVEHRQVAVAFLKFSGVDAPIRADGPASVAPALDTLGRLVGETCAEYGVTWLESDIDVDGGKLYLVAGAPSTAGDNEERLLRALRAILDTWDGPLKLKAGINRGHAFAGEIGMSDRRTYAVMGDVVNLAARLTARAGEGEILATTDVLARSRARFEQSEQPFLVKGKERAVTAVHIGAFAGLRPQEAGHDLPTVGRERELERLRMSVDGARARTTQAIELVGAPGIGKSRLLHELKVTALGFQQLETACDPYASSVPYFAFRAMLRQLAGITPERNAQEAGAQLAAWIPAVMPDLAPLLPLLAIPFDAEVAQTPEADAVDRAFRRDRVHELVVQFLQRVLLMPTLIIFEDAQWIDDASQQLLLRLVDDPLPKPWLVCVARRGDGPSIVGDAGEALTLAPLTAAEAEQLALSAARDQPLSQEAVQVVAERSGGNPLFVQALVAASVAGAGLDNLPETIEALLTERIDSLDPGDRLLLRHASVVGPSFDLELLGDVLGDERVRASERERWARLDEFVVWDDGETLRFRQELFRTAAYEGLSFQRRRQIHGRVAEALERRAGSVDAGDLLSLHFLRAERWDETWSYAVTAARRAQQRYANVVAAELYERALVASRHLPGLEPAHVAEVYEALGDVCELFSSFERAGVVYAAAKELTEEPAAQARLLLKSGVVLERVGRYDDAIDSYDRALELIADGGETLALRIELELATAGIRHRQGRVDEAIEWAERAAANAKKGGSINALAHAYYLLDLAYTTLGRPKQEYREQALPIYRESGDLVGQASVLNNLGIGAYFEGRWDEALEFYRESGEVSRRAGDVVSGARASNNVAEILSDQGKLADAAEVFAEARRIWRAGRYPIGAQLATSNLGRAEARAGRFEEGLRLLGEARRGFAEIGAAGFELEARAREAECLVLAGRYHEALEICTEALERSKGIAGGEVACVSLERSLGYALAQARRKDESKPHLEQSAQLARELKLDYELALTLKALADTNATVDAGTAFEAEQMLAGLGVEWVPSPPLP